jgi:hypothetical protein
LKGRDVVLGKFIGTSLSAGYSLLALLPVAAIPILLGGVGLLEFGRMALAILNTLFVSLAVGLGVSAFVSNYSRGVAATLGILALLGAGIPALAELGSRMGWPAACLRLGWISPFYPFFCARDAVYVLEPHKFWLALVASHWVGWLCLARGSAGVSRAWTSADVSGSRAKPARRPPRTSRRSQHARVSAGESFDPVSAFMGDAALIRRAAWLVVIGWGMVLGVSRCWARQGLPEVVAAGACAFMLKALVAFQACRFFVETRRNGALELLLCTPLRNSDLLKGQWRALLRIFLWPAITFLVLCWVAFLSGPHRMPLGPFALAASGSSGLRTGPMGALFLTVTLGTDVMAICWFGTWLALTARKPGLAPALTILAVLVLPSMLSHFDLVADMLFISWGSTHLQEDFRRLTDPTLPQPEAAAATEEAPPLAVVIAPTKAAR